MRLIGYLLFIHYFEMTSGIIGTALSSGIGNNDTFFPHIIGFSSYFQHILKLKHHDLVSLYLDRL